MATSGSTDFAQTSRDVCTTALRLIGACDVAEDPDADDAALALTHLNLTLKTWGVDPKLFINADAQINPLVASQAAYSVASARRVEEGRLRTSAVDRPLEKLSRAKYMAITNKTQTGAPNGFYFDPQRSARTVTLWPVPDATTAAASTFVYTYRRVIEDSDSLDNDPDVPQEWLETLTYALAARLTLPFKTALSDPATAQAVNQMAGSLYARLTADSDEEESVFIQPAFS